MLRRVFKAIGRAVGSDETKDRAKLVEDVLFGNLASADVEAMRVVSELVSSLCDRKSEAAIDGRIFVFFKVKKSDGEFQVFTKTLTVTERALINSQPTILAEPHRLLERLENAKAVDAKRAAELRRIAGRESPPQIPPAA
jgi:hypothetical protein